MSPQAIYRPARVPRRRIALAAIGMLAGLLALTSAAVARAETQPVTLSTALETLQLPETGDATLLVVAQNTSTAPVRALQLSALPHAGLDVTIPASELQALAPGASHAWLVSLALVEREQLEAEVQFRLDYRSPGSPDTAGVAFTTVSVTTIAPQPVSEVVALTLLGSDRPVYEQQPAAYTLLISNSTALPVTIEQVRVTTGPFLEAKELPTTPFTIGGQSSYPLRFTVSAPPAIQPGREALTVSADVTWRRRGVEQHGTVTTTRDVTIGVLGETAALTVLGVPSLLILPGFLLLAAFGYAAGFGKGEARPPWLPAAGSADFWMLAITGSIAITVVYPALSNGRNYLVAYGLGDIVRLWLGTLLAGGTLGAVVRAVPAIIRWRRTPAAGDEPHEAIAKLGRRRESLQRPRVELAPATAALLLADPEQNGAQVWVTPRIALAWKASAPPELQHKARQFMEAGDAAGLAAFLARRTVKRHTSLSWKPSGLLSRPRLVAHTAVTEGGNSLLLVEDQGVIGQ
jgi:hypothetical protein